MASTGALAQKRKRRETRFGAGWLRGEENTEEKKTSEKEKTLTTTVFLLRWSVLFLTLETTYEKHYYYFSQLSQVAAALGIGLAVP